MAEERIPTNSLGPVDRSATPRALWTHPGWRRWLLAASLARLGGTMTPFALLLAGQRARGSFASGAGMASAFALGAAVGAPFRGRALDRRSLPGGLGVP